MSAKRNLLVVDDNKLNRTILGKILESDGYSVLEAENGLIAYQTIANDPQSIALVLLDIGMPVMDGYELLRKLNETELIRSVPVIVTTGNDEEDLELRCLEQGASDFIKKPYNADLVRHRVQSLLRLWDNAAWINQLEIDQLTGLYSKEPFYRHAREALDKAEDTEFELVYTDIDDFKMINARYGSDTGDELLRYLARFFRDSVGSDGVCGRVGPDNFALLQKRQQLMSQEQVGERMEDAFTDSPVKGFQLKSGVYPVTNRALALSDMCDRAKLAAASIKRQYGVYFAIYADTMRESALREHQLAGCMAEALEKKQFVVYLQPKHNTDSGEVVGAEALIRWIHPELGFISPGEFIPLFESNGFISKLDCYVWTEVCGVLKRWMDSGITPVPISVNASCADFMSPDLPKRILKIVDSFGVPHSFLHFEVTESAYTDHPQQIIDAVSMLRDMGFLIEMDDFGSGYSSLNMLSELPIDILKLDMRFMQGGNERIKGGKRNILSFIVSLSKWLQLPTIAEGVETKVEFELLKTMGCNMIQGYYFARPMAVADFEKYMLERRSSDNRREEQNKTGDPVEAALPANRHSDAEKPSVLVVEDIETNREILKALLSPYYNVTALEDGKQACEYLQNHREDTACVLLDLLLPVMDGFQVLEVMRSNGMIDDIPVIITTETGSDSELRALHIGADSFVAKPYNPEILLHHVKKAVEEKTLRKIRRELENRAQLLNDMSYRDELTGLLNRRGMEKAFESITVSERYSVVLLDIDDMHEFNLNYGFLAGDALLRAAAKEMTRSTRQEDILARVGGDEFVLVLRGMSEQSSALEKCRRLRDSIRDIRIADINTPVSCSAGVVVIHPPEKLDELYRMADLALYRAKKPDNDGCCVLNGRETDEIKPE